MSLALFSLFTLCISVGSTEDCSWQWDIIDDREEFESLYTNLRPSNKDSHLIQGAALSDYKQIYVYNSIYSTNILLHEIDHAVCYLNNLHPMGCNIKVDVRDYGKLNIVRYLK